MSSPSFPLSSMLQFSSRTGKGCFLGSIAHDTKIQAICEPASAAGLSITVIAFSCYTSASASTSLDLDTNQCAYAADVLQEYGQHAILCYACLLQGMVAKVTAVSPCCLINAPVGIAALRPVDLQIGLVQHQLKTLNDICLAESQLRQMLHDHARPHMQALISMAFPTLSQSDAESGTLSCSPKGFKKPTRSGTTPQQALLCFSPGSLVYTVQRVVSAPAPAMLCGGAPAC